MVVIQEPKVSGLRAQRIVEARGFDSSIRVDAVSFSGGIWILQKSNKVDLEVVSAGTQVINAIIHMGNQQDWLLSVIYASISAGTRQLLWEAFVEASKSLTLLWAVVGDFNQVGDPKDKKGGATTYSGRMVRFTEFVDECELIDLGFSGPRFT